MHALGRYDGTLQMFTQESRDADTRHLRFLRWLAEHGVLEHAVAGPPCGHYWSAIADDTGDAQRLAG